MISNERVMKYGIICATLREALLIFSDRRVQFDRHIQGYYFAEIEYEYFNIIIGISNIGLENAAKCCSVLIKYFPVDCVVNIGTCGSVDPVLEKGTVIIPARLVLIGSSQQIIAIAKLCNKAQQTLQSHFASCHCQMDFDNVAVLVPTLPSSTDFVTLNHKISMKRLGYSAVDMEAFAIVVTCSQHPGIPIAILKIVVDTYETKTNNYEDYLIYESNVFSQYGDHSRKVVWKCLHILSDGFSHEK